MAKELDVLELKTECLTDPTLMIGVVAIADYCARLTIHSSAVSGARFLKRHEAEALRDWLDSALASQSSQTEEAAA